MPEQALSDVKVLDLTELIAGPYCTKMLADYGADVLKVERPGAGDPARGMGPFPGDEPHTEKSGLFLHLNTNKKGITLNLECETGRKICRELVKDADILVESFKPGTMEEMGMGWEELERISPKLVMTRITPFGQTGPYKDYKATEIVVMAMGGPMYATGINEREPVKYAGNVELYGCGGFAATATMVAFYVAEHEGVGQVVDFSMIEALHSCVNFQLNFHTGYQYTGEISARASSIGFGLLPSGGFPCKDGYVYMIVDPGWWPKLVQLMEMPDLLERFPNVFDSTRKDEFDAILLPWLLDRTKKELHMKAGALKLNLAAVNTMDDVFNDEQFGARGTFVEIDHPVAGKLTYPGRPFIMPDTPWQIRMPAPLLGQHNEEVYGKLGYAREDLVKLRERGVI